MKSKQENLAELAKQLVENPVYQAAIIKIKGDLYNEFKRTGLFQKRKREHAWIKAQLLDALEREIASAITSGYKAQLDRERQSRNKNLRGL